MFGASFEGTSTTNRNHSINLIKYPFQKTQLLVAGHWSDKFHASVFRITPLRTEIVFDGGSLRGSLYVQ
jgi:hypothetical protein